MNDEALAPENQTIAQQTKVGPMPWERKGMLPEKPGDSPYGYKSGRRLKPCSRRELIRICSQERILPVSLVWTPEFPRLLPPVHVPYLRPSLIIRRKTELKTGIFLGSFLLLTTGAQYLATRQTFMLAGFFLVLAALAVNIKILYSIKE